MHTTAYTPLFSPRLAESMNVEHRGPFSPSFTTCTLLVTLLYIANLSFFYPPSSIPCINPAELCTLHMLFSPKEKLQTIPSWLSGGAHKGIIQWVLTGALLFIHLTLVDIYASKDVLVHCGHPYLCSLCPWSCNVVKGNFKDWWVRVGEWEWSSQYVSHTHLPVVPKRLPQLF